MEVDQVDQQLVADAAHEARRMPANVLRKAAGKDDDVAGRRSVVALHEIDRKLKWKFISRGSKYSLYRVMRNIFV